MSPLQQRQKAADWILQLQLCSSWNGRRKGLWGKRLQNLSFGLKASSVCQGQASCPPDSGANGESSCTWAGWPAFLAEGRDLHLLPLSVLGISSGDRGDRQIQPAHCWPQSNTFPALLTTACHNTVFTVEVNCKLSCRLQLPCWFSRV